MALPAYKETPGEQRAHSRPPWALNVVWDLGWPEVVDWSSWCLTDEEDEGQNPRQTEVIFALKDCIEARLDELGQGNAYVAADAFFAWVESEPLVRVSPDICVLAERPQPLPASFQLWKPGAKPLLLAVEVVSEDWKKDYDNTPLKYAQLGAGELVVFDPDAVDRSPRGPERTPIQVFRRSEDGVFARAYAGNGPAFIRSLDCFAVVASKPGAPILRLTYDAEGRRLVPTLAERAALDRDSIAHERDGAIQALEAERQRRAELGA